MKIARSAGQVRAGAAQAPLPRPSQRRGDGVVIWNFRAELDDDITVFAGEEVTILDTTSNEGRWKVRRLRDGAEGIMPGSRIEVFGTVSDIGISYLNPSRLTNEQDRHSSQLAESSQGSNQPESSSFQERGRSIIAVVIPNTIENSANAPRLDSRSVPKTYEWVTAFNLWLSSVLIIPLK